MDISRFCSACQCYMDEQLELHSYCFFRWRDKKFNNRRKGIRTCPCNTCLKSLRCKQFCNDYFEHVGKFKKLWPKNRYLSALYRYKKDLEKSYGPGKKY